MPEAVTFGTSRELWGSLDRPMAGSLSRRGRRFLRIGGIATWLLSAVPAVLMLAGKYQFGDAAIDLPPRRFALWSAAALVFMAAFWLTTGAVGDDGRKRRARSLLAVQTVAALFMFHFVCTGLETTLLIVVAVQLGLFVPVPVGLLWVLAQTAILAYLGTRHWGASLSVGWTVLAIPPEVLAIFTSYFAGNETRARQELARANAELRATQELLADSSRMAERVRISRDLHDLLGHHLTALSLNLEAARLRTAGEVRDQIESCQALTKLLLSDVRDVVSSLRPSETVDLARVLRPLTDGIPAPKIHLSVPPNFEVSDSEQAQTVVRCVQEIVTNALRHAACDNLWIELSRIGDGLEVRARDDGRGACKVEPGHGLSGMRERVEKLGGRLHVASEPNRGFSLTAWMPLAEGAP